MSESGWELGLADADNAGVYFVTNDDLDTLGVAARDAVHDALVFLVLAGGVAWGLVQRHDERAARHHLDQVALQDGVARQRSQSQVK